MNPEEMLAKLKASQPQDSTTRANLRKLREGIIAVEQNAASVPAEDVEKCFSNFSRDELLGLVISMQQEYIEQMSKRNIVPSEMPTHFKTLKLIMTAMPGPDWDEVLDIANDISKKMAADE